MDVDGNTILRHSDDDAHLASVAISVESGEPILSINMAVTAVQTLLLRASNPLCARRRSNRYL